ncbi:unnamed protein product [Coregonus sp. 'balchen']|nr:unnamed protein product [Coregonus sp. 'balchen']
MTAQNIFLAKSGMKAKLGDFGIARMDIWSLGCVLYERCTFRHPSFHPQAAQVKDPAARQYSQQDPRWNGQAEVNPYDHYHAQLDTIQRRYPPPPPPPLLLTPPHPPLSSHHPPVVQERPVEHYDDRENRTEPYQSGVVATARNESLQRRQEANQYKLRAGKQLGLRPSTADAEWYRQPEQDQGAGTLKEPCDRSVRRTDGRGELQKHKDKTAPMFEIKLNDEGIQEDEEEEKEEEKMDDKRIVDDKKLDEQETLLDALAEMDMSSVCTTMAVPELEPLTEKGGVEDRGGRKIRCGSGQGTPGAQNFEESEDELREEVAESMINLFIMEDGARCDTQTKKPGEAQAADEDQAQTKD